MQIFECLELSDDWVTYDPITACENFSPILAAARIIFF